MVGARAVYLLVSQSVSQSHSQSVSQSVRASLRARKLLKLDQTTRLDLSLFTGARIAISGGTEEFKEMRTAVHL